MRTEDLKRINIFSFDEKTGFPLLELNRVCIIGQAGLARLRSDLIRSMGRECMTTVCFRYGYETGISLAIVIKENYPLDGKEEYLRACGMMLSMAGAANVEFREMRFDPDGRLARCTGIWRNSINVRELENWVEYAVILAGNERIRPEHLPLKNDQENRDLLLLLAGDLPTCAELEKRYIRHVLERTGRNKSEAARILGIGVTTLWRRRKEKRID